MVKDNFFVLTGGPGGGKSTLIAALRLQGFGSVDETARTIIKERLTLGLSPRPSPREFAIEMFDRDLRNFLDNQEQSKVTFFDRSFLDSAALVHESDIEYFRRIKKVIGTHRFNSKVFIVPPWKEIYSTDDERDQTFEEALMVYDKLYDWYKLNGYRLCILPKTSIELRVNFIINEIQAP